MIDISFLWSLFTNEMSFTESLRLINTNMFGSSAMIILLSALIYFIGKLKLSDDILHTKEKGNYYFAGMVEINNMVILPLTFLALLWMLFNSRWSTLLCFLFFFSYQEFLKIRSNSFVKKSREKTLNYKNSDKSHIEGDKILYSKILLSEVFFGFILLSFNLFLLNMVLPPILFLIILWTDFTCIVFITQIISNIDVHKPVKIKLSDGKILDNVRIIEYLNDLDFLKIEENKKIKIIPKSDIVFIEEDL